MYSAHLILTCVAAVLTSLILVVSSTQLPVLPNLDALKMKPKIENLNKVSLKGKPVPPCIACQSLVKSFLVAVEKTTRQGFLGGDADWERQKLGNYENSELRFIEIQEILCTDVELGKDQCYNLAEEYESELEDWFYENRKKNLDLYQSLCIDHVKVCCPNNTYGPNCIPCPGGIEKPCGGHGKCRKGGTREEPASCVCDTGYTGESCGECENGFYSQPDVPSLLCKKCHRACKSHCRGPGPINCEVCAPNYHFVPDKGCIEIVEGSEKDEAASSNAKKIDNVNSSSESTQVNVLDDATDKEEKLQLNANIDDSTSNIPPHSEF